MLLPVSSAAQCPALSFPQLHQAGVALGVPCGCPQVSVLGLLGAFPHLACLFFFLNCHVFRHLKCSVDTWGCLWLSPSFWGFLGYCTGPHSRGAHWGMRQCCCGYIQR